MSASSIPPVQVTCDFHIREATGGWILSYPEGFWYDSDEDEYTVNYVERVFTDEKELAEFICKQMTGFKSFRSRKVVEVNASREWIDYMNPGDTSLPKPPKGR